MIRNRREVPVPPPPDNDDIYTNNDQEDWSDTSFDEDEENYENLEDGQTPDQRMPPPPPPKAVDVTPVMPPVPRRSSDAPVKLPAGNIADALANALISRSVLPKSANTRPLPVPPAQVVQESPAGTLSRNQRSLPPVPIATQESQESIDDVYEVADEPPPQSKKVPVNVLTSRPLPPPPGAAASNTQRSLPPPPPPEAEVDDDDDYVEADDPPQKQLNPRATRPIPLPPLPEPPAPQSNFGDEVYECTEVYASESAAPHPVPVPSSRAVPELPKLPQIPLPKIPLSDESYIDKKRSGRPVPGAVPSEPKSGKTIKTSESFGGLTTRPLIPAGKNLKNSESFSDRSSSGPTKPVVSRNSDTSSQKTSDVSSDRSSGAEGSLTNELTAIRSRLKRVSVDNGASSKVPTETGAKVAAAAKDESETGMHTPRRDAKAPVAGGGREAKGTTNDDARSSSPAVQRNSSDVGARSAADRTKPVPDMKGIPEPPSRRPSTVPTVQVVTSRGESASPARGALPEPPSRRPSGAPFLLETTPAADEDASPAAATTNRRTASPKPPGAPGRGGDNRGPLPPVPMAGDSVPDDLFLYPWYVSNMSRKDAEAKLRATHQDGAFVIRVSQNGGAVNPYTLTLLYRNNPYNLHVRRRSDNKFAIGNEKPDEIVFKTVPELISFYSNNPIDLIGDTRRNIASGRVVLKICALK